MLQLEDFCEARTVKRWNGKSVYCRKCVVTRHAEWADKNRPYVLMKQRENYHKRKARKPSTLEPETKQAA